LSVQQEYFADFLALNNDLFSLNLSAPSNPIFFENPTSWDVRTFGRSTEGILSVLLSLKKKPLIRYERGSVLGKKLAAEVAVSII
jgi:hypothetical protein